jgi:hypothetical protein
MNCHCLVQQEPKLKLGMEQKVGEIPIEAVWRDYLIGIPWQVMRMVILALL